MIRLTYALRRNPHLPFEEFQRYWRENHGPLVAKHAKTLNIVRYIQVHAIADPDIPQPPGARGVMAKPHDGVAELWFPNRDAIEQSTASLEGQAAIEELLEDESKFIDLKHSPGWFGYELPQINPTPENIVAAADSSLVKLYYPLHHHSHQSLEEAQLYWRMHHGPLVRRFGQTLNILRYIQVHRLEDELNTIFAEARGTEDPPYCGHAELWYDRSAEVRATPEETAAAQDALVKDERKFIDFTRSVIWFGKEHVFVDQKW